MGCAPQDGQTPLFGAALLDKVAVVQVLLDAGANMEATDKVRAKRGGHGGGVGGETGLCLLFPWGPAEGFGESSNLEYGSECRRSCPIPTLQTVVVEWRIFYNGGCKTKGQGAGAEC